MSGINMIGHWNSRLIAAALILFQFADASAMAQDQKRFDETENSDSIRAQRIKLVARIASQHRVAPAEQPDSAFELQPEPLMHWTNPTRGDAFGSIFLWTENGRPMAYGGVFLWFDKPATHMTREFHSLTNKRLAGDFDSKRIWAPDRPGVEFRVVTGSRPQVESRTARLLQIKKLTSQFTVTISQPDTPPESLRHLPRPIYRYSDADSGVIDGAIMAYVQGTDPEALLLIEARSNAEGLRWHYAFARCTAWSVTAQLNDDVVYKVPFYNFSKTNRSAPFFNVTRTRLD